MGIEGMYLNMVKAIYDKLMVNTILKDGKLSKIRNNIRMLSLTTLIQHILEVLAKKKKKKRNKRHLYLKRKKQNCHYLQMA